MPETDHIVKEKIHVSLQESGVPVDLPDCYTRIAEIAYYKAEGRDFEPGHELEDWFQNESLCSKEGAKHITY